MVEQAPTTAIRETVAARLREISTLNGYRTNVGAKVVTEPGQYKPEEGSRITVWPGTRLRPGDARSFGERGFSIVIEVEVPTSLETPLAELEAAEADIEQALDQWVQQPLALPLAFEESVILDRPDGVAAMASQVMFITRYRR